MSKQDTVKLLRECDAGVKMAAESIDEVIGDVRSPELKKCLTQYSRRHKNMGDEIHRRLLEYRDDGKEPNPMAKGMSWMKTNMKMALDGSDETIADLITDGCDMGIKSLNRYLNQYEAADEASKSMARRLIRLEEDLTQEVRSFL